MQNSIGFILVSLYGKSCYKVKCVAFHHGMDDSQRSPVENKVMSVRKNLRAEGENRKKEEASIVEKEKKFKTDYA